MSITIDLYRNAALGNRLDGAFPLGDGVGGPTSTPNLFYDSFESGDMSAPASPSPALNTVNFSWQALNSTSIVKGASGSNEVVYPTPNVINDSRDWSAKDGVNSLRFRYSTTTDISEQRFNFSNQTELWIRYWVRVPTNFSHGSLNNKFFSIWGDTYDTDGTITWQTRPSSGGSANLVVQDGGVISGEILTTPFIDVTTDLGKWMQVVMHIKLETSNGAGDGILRFYRRWEDEGAFTLLQEKTDCVNQWGDGLGYRRGYFMGWANDRYSVDTEWLIDKVEMSTGSLL